MQETFRGRLVCSFVADHDIYGLRQGHLSVTVVRGQGVVHIDYPLRIEESTDIYHRLLMHTGDVIVTVEKDGERYRGIGPIETLPPSTN
jgi:hypothetical protein